MARTTTIAQSLRSNTSGSDADLSLILFAQDELDPLNLKTRKKPERLKVPLRVREEEWDETWSVKIWCLCLVVEDGLDAALMPVKMTTHRPHTNYAGKLSNLPF